MFKLTPAALCCAATLPIMVLLASSPASAQFACMTTTNIDCTNTGPNGAGSNTVTGTLNVTNTNSGTNTGGINTVTTAGGSVTNTISGTNSGGINTVTTGGGTVTNTNSGTNTGGINTTTIGANSGVTVSNSGSNTGGINTTTIGANSGVAITNSGSNANGIFVTTVGAGSNIAVTNSGSTTGGIGLDAVNGNTTLTNVVGGRVVGPISLVGVNDFVNFQGGNWLFTFNTLAGATINTGGAPFVVVGRTVAVLDATTFALANRSLMNFTGEIAEMLPGRFDGMPTGSGGPIAMSFAAPSPGIAGEAQAAFAGIPSGAMSYASDARPIIGKAPPPTAVPYYDTTVWASSFGGERHQRADGLVLPTQDWAYGGALGVDRLIGPNLRLGAFVGAGASREAVELDVQKIDATYIFGGAYGRFDWVTQYLDFALYGGGINNKSTRGIANNTVPTGFENATASYGGWFISPELIYGYRIPFNAVTVTPRLRLRYVGGELDGYSESGSMQNLSVGRRDINELEERGEVEFSTVSGALKGMAYIGVIGLERLGNPNINTVLLSQTLSFTTPGQRNAVGGVLGAGLQYRAMPNVNLFVAGKGIAMSDKSDSFVATGGAQVSF